MLFNIYSMIELIGATGKSDPISKRLDMLQKSINEVCRSQGALSEIYKSKAYKKHGSVSDIQVHMTTFDRAIAAFRENKSLTSSTPSELVKLTDVKKKEKELFDNCTSWMETLDNIAGGFNLDEPVEPFRFPFRDVYIRIHLISGINHDQLIEAYNLILNTYLLQDIKVGKKKP